MVVKAFECNRLLSELSTFGIGGPARYFVEVTTVTELQEVLRRCQYEGLKFFVMGRGSNCLFDDRGYDGVIVLNRIEDCEERERGIFDVGAG